MNRIKKIARKREYHKFLNKLEELKRRRANATGDSKSKQN